MSGSRPTNRKRSLLKRGCAGLVGGLLVVLVLGWLNFWKIAGVLMEQQSGASEVVVTPIADGLFMLDATLRDRQIGGSHLALVSSAGTLLVDAPMTSAVSAKVRAALDEQGAGPLEVVINTHPHPDHARGNSFLPDGARVMAHENSRRRLTERPRPNKLLPAAPALEERFLPGETVSDGDQLDFHGHRVEIWHFGPGHTDGDLAVYFPGANVLHVGDLFHGRGGRSAADWQHSGGDIESLALVLERVLARLPEGARVVGGHGGIGQVWARADLAEYQRLLVEITAWVQSEIDAGASVEEVAENGVPRGWQAWFDEARSDSVMHGPPGGWLENIYASLTR